MTPLEKASQLIVDYQLTVTSLDYDEAVQCSIRTVDSLLQVIEPLGHLSAYEYWQEVKELLKKQVNKMTLRHALLILQSHQKWRSGDEFAEATEPKVLTEAINTILQYHIGSTTALIDHIVDTNEMVSSQTEISDEEIEDRAAEWMEEDWDVKTYYEAFIDGASWYREQLKQRQ